MLMSPVGKVEGRIMMLCSAYGLCQTACNAAYMTCCAAAGAATGVATAGVGTPAPLAACSAAQASCMVAFLFAVHNVLIILHIKFLSYLLLFYFIFFIWFDLYASRVPVKLSCKSVIDIHFILLSTSEVRSKDENVNFIVCAPCVESGWKSEWCRQLTLIPIATNKCCQTACNAGYAAYCTTIYLNNKMELFHLISLIIHMQDAQQYKCAAVMGCYPTSAAIFFFAAPSIITENSEFFTMKKNIILVFAFLLGSAAVVDGGVGAVVASYGLCQTACNTGYVACMSAATGTWC
uniref:Uncharacterized protein n=1 Tax=Strigamia maritima TaxID=126957 RepID=T1J1B9_STRMM